MSTKIIESIIADNGIAQPGIYLATAKDMIEEQLSACPKISGTSCRNKR